MSQQTAVDWLKMRVVSETDLQNLLISIDNWFEQAKQMEKDQITNAFTNGYIQWDSELTSEEYYNKQYKQ